MTRGWLDTPPTPAGDSKASAELLARAWAAKAAKRECPCCPHGPHFGPCMRPLSVIGSLPCPCVFSPGDAGKGDQTP